MRDPMSWSLPLYRAFDITVRLHLLYILITVALTLRIGIEHPDAWVDFLIFFGVLLFFAVLFYAITIVRMGD